MTLSGKTQQHLGRCCDTKQSRDRQVGTESPPESLGLPHVLAASRRGLHMLGCFSQRLSRPSRTESLF